MCGELAHCVPTETDEAAFGLWCNDRCYRQETRVTVRHSSMCTWYMGSDDDVRPLIGECLYPDLAPPVGAMHTPRFLVQTLVRDDHPSPTLPRQRYDTVMRR
jgi:hypothetical protein